MKPLPTQIAKQRTKTLTEFFYSYEPYNDRIGARYSVLVTDVSHDKNHYVGHNDYYEQVSTS
jgi:threonylcarbamoyladenosine tRNA methylthiotransferase CDKAL1